MSVQISGDGTITGLDADGISSQPVFPGNVLQVVSTAKINQFTTTSNSFVDVTGLSATITPTSATSKILVLMDVVVTTSDVPDAGNSGVQLVRNSTNIAVSTGGNVFNGTGFGTSRAEGPYAKGDVSVSFLDSPNTTNSTTYKVTAKTAAGTLFINTDRASENGAVSTLTLMEIAG